MFLLVTDVIYDCSRVSVVRLDSESLKKFAVSFVRGRVKFLESLEQLRAGIHEAHDVAIRLVSAGASVCELNEYDLAAGSRANLRHAREMEDVFWRRLPSLYRSAYRFLGNAASSVPHTNDRTAERGLARKVLTEMPNRGAALLTSSKGLIGSRAKWGASLYAMPWCSSCVRVKPARCSE